MVTVSLTLLNTVTPAVVAVITLLLPVDIAESATEGAPSDFTTASLAAIDANSASPREDGF